MQKILFVITKSNWGGAQRYVYDLASSLPRSKWSVGVVLGGTGLPGTSGGRLEEELRHKDIRTLFVPALIRDVSLAAEWKTLRYLWDIFVVEQPDIVHLNSSKAGGLGALAGRLAGVPNIIFTLHGLPWDEDRNAVSRFFIRFFSWLTFLFCDRIIVVSSDALLRVSSLPLCGKKVRLVHNGIGPLQFLSKKDARAELGIASDAFCIGAVGELTWNKGYHVLLRAAGDLKRRGSRFILLIVGEGEERRFIETMIDEEKLEDTVFLVGFVANAYRIIKAFDIFVLPSIKEGLPYVLIEAGLAGMPVVVSRVGGVPDLVGDRVTGLLAASKNHTELADRLAELMDNIAFRQKLGVALYERALKEFSLTHMVDGTIAIYKD